MSIPTVSVKWLCKVGERALGRRGRYLPTVSRPTSTPSLTNSRWMRGVPQNELAELIWRIKSRISAFVLDRPEPRDRHR
jgi:hypothetical protein